MIFFIGGENTVATKKKLDEIIEKFQEKHSKHFNLLYFSAKNNFTEFKSLFESSTLFSPKKLVVLRDALKKENIKFFEEFLTWARASDIGEDKDNFLIVYDAATLSSAAMKFFGEKPAQFFYFEKLQGAALRAWTEQELKKERVPSSPDLIARLVALQDAHAIGNEIAKLAAFLAGAAIMPKNATERMRSVGTEPQKGTPSAENPFEVFEAMNYLLSGKKERAIAVIKKQLQEGKSEGMIIGGLHHQLKNLIVVKYLIARGYGQDEIVKKTKMHPFVCKKNAAVAAKVDFLALKNIQEKLLECDMRIKSGRIEEKTALDWFVSEL